MGDFNLLVCISQFLNKKKEQETSMCVMPFSFYFNLNYFICNILRNEGEEKRQRWKQIHKLCQHSFLFFWLFKILELNKKTQRERDDVVMKFMHACIMITASH